MLNFDKLLANLNMTHNEIAVLTVITNCIHYIDFDNPFSVKTYLIKSDDHKYMSYRFDTSHVGVNENFHLHHIMNYNESLSYGQHSANYITIHHVHLMQKMRFS